MNSIARNIQIRKVVGAGGRLRTIAECEIGHWHGNYGQAYKCKEAQYRIGAMEPPKKKIRKTS